MRAIRKFTLDLAQDMAVQMPHGARILSAALDPNGVPQLWAEVDTDAPVRPRRLSVHGTGEPLEPVGAHIATFQVDVDGDPYVFHLFDQTEHDPVTACLHAGALHARMLALPVGAAPAALVVFDVDAMKDVNDIHGLPVGEYLLRSVADRMRAHVRAHGGGFVARIGGDEFAVLVPEASVLAAIDGPSTTIAAALSDLDDTPASPAAVMAEELRARLAEPYRLGDQALQVGFSAGLSFFVPGSRPADALRQADEAVQEAKLAGRGCLRVAPGPHPA